MIQRIQTLFLLEIVFLGISLMFIPVVAVTGLAETLELSFLPSQNSSVSSGGGHLAATGLNILSIALALVAIFVFKKRQLQIKLCYMIALLQLVLILMLILCPMAVLIDPSKGSIQTSGSLPAYVILSVNLISSFLAARYVKKDIELLKSADRIR